MISLMLAHSSVGQYITPEEMAQEERRAIEKGMTTGELMENAGRAVAEEVVKRYGSGRRVLVVAGSGNNGGDGMFAAKYLSEGGADIKIILLCTPDGIKTDEARAIFDQLCASGVPVRFAIDRGQAAACGRMMQDAEVILDAILGTGTTGELREPQATAIAMINESGAKKVAVDIPSGLDPLTGEVKSQVVRADLTVALHRAKAGLRDRVEYTGEVAVAPIGIG